MQGSHDTILILIALVNVMFQNFEMSTEARGVCQSCRSVVYYICYGCRLQEDPFSWSPPNWQRACPFPYCPTYREFARDVSLLFIVVSSWGVLYCAAGDIALPPSGKLFQIMFLTISAHLAGRIVTLVTFPPLVGMLYTGLAYQNLGVINLDESFEIFSDTLRKLALICILVGTGLQLNPKALRRVKLTLAVLSFGPLSTEVITVAITSYFLLGLPLLWSFALGAIISGVAPAVIMSCLFTVRSLGYGMAKGIPTLIIAVAGMNSALAVVLFELIITFIRGEASLVIQISRGPVSIISGILFGLIWGYVASYAPERYDPYLDVLRNALLVIGGAIAIYASEKLGYSSAGPIACVVLGFVCAVNWAEEGWDIKDNPALTFFRLFWKVIEPLLFGVTGALDLSEITPGQAGWSIAVLMIAIAAKILSTVFIFGLGSNMNYKERVFFAICLMAKATVQAALGPVLMIHAITEEEEDYGDTVNVVCVLSIMILCPAAAILISATGIHLLTKTPVSENPVEWRKSHRPIVKDISVASSMHEMASYNLQSPLPADLEL